MVGLANINYRRHCGVGFFCHEEADDDNDEDTGGDVLVLDRDGGHGDPCLWASCSACAFLAALALVLF